MADTTTELERLLEDTLRALLGDTEALIPNAGERDAVKRARALIRPDDNEAALASRRPIVLLPDDQLQCMRCGNIWPATDALPPGYSVPANENQP